MCVSASAHDRRPVDGPGTCRAYRRAPGIRAACMACAAYVAWNGTIDEMVDAFGVLAVSFMVAMYALESRGPAFTVAFALGCLLSSAYGFLSGAWPFGVVEIVWAVIAVRRWRARIR